MATEVIGAPPVTRGERRAVIALTAAFALLLTLWAFLTPMFSAPDEAAHYDAAEQLALGKGWPAPGDMDLLAITYAEQQQVGTVAAAHRETVADLTAQNPGNHDFVNQMTQHPPTYYGVGAVVLKGIGFFHLRWDLGVMALRMLDVVMLVPLPFLTWATVRRVTRSPRTAIVGVLALFAVPQLAQIGSSVTNDAPVILLGGVIAWLAARALTGDHRWRIAVWLGVAVAAVCSVKGTGLPTVPFVAVALLVAGHGHLSWGARIGRTAVAGAIVAALGSWWWIRNLLVFGSLQPDGVSALRQERPWGRETSANFGDFMNVEWDRLTSSFWGQFGALRYPMTQILTDSLTVIALAVIVGWAFRRSANRTAALVMLITPAITLVIQLQNNFASYDSTQIIAGAQGRYLFIGLVPLIVISAVAWRNLLTSAVERDRFGRIVRWAFPVIGLYGLTVAYRGFYEHTHLQVTTHGLALLANLTPAGRFGFAAIAALLVVATLWAALEVSRNTVRRALPVASTTDPTPTATQRNQTT
ncbi:hypothetical protein FHW23_002962 [Curtobacterium pusillum]|uniref:DUF2142 domain-containing protein n=1 Tax=Curtobacterium pusillum TaxID=69373 RepID=A0AAW3TA92_9MICO|nr:DUF2142 domain-containing protein [Curtobacterium pusillum]MBA8991684.1 hypothetical protein [Curtobacterium pusillum]